MAQDPKEEEIIDFGEARAKKLEEKRRKTERILFKQMLGMYCVTGDERLRSLDINDVSEDGMSFQVPFDSEDPWPKNLEEISLRMYFSQDTYLPLRIRIQNSRPSIENGMKFMRYGCEIDKTFASYPAFLQFVRFMKAYSEEAHRDLGDATLFYL